MFIIGSFNLYKMNFQSDKERKKSFEDIAEIIIKEGYDVIALQEVLSDQACKELLRHLGPKWVGRWEFPRKSSASAAEGFAFLWNSMTMGLTTNDDGKEFEPSILNQYRIDRKSGQTELIRNPFFGRFTPKLLPKVEFRLINVHFRFEKDDELELSAVKQRKNEFGVLTQAIYPKCEDKQYGNNNASYTFILGDYNLNIVKPTILDGRDRYCPLDEVVYVDDKKIITVQEKLTTVKMSDNQKSEDEVNDVEINNLKTQKIKEDIKALSELSPDYYANNYDHFTYNAEIDKRLFLLNDRVDAVGKYYQRDSDRYRREVSDHVPIKLVIEPNTNKIVIVS